MDQIGRAASFALLAVFSTMAAAANDGGDGVARNLLQRQQQEQGPRFGVNLNDNPAPLPQSSVDRANGPVHVSPPTALPFDDRPIQVGPRAADVPLPPAGSGGRALLNDSQLNRFDQLQLQNRNLDDSARQQQIQTQQLQFDRENQAHQLHDQLQHGSPSVVPQIR